MNLKITSQKINSLLKRKEVTFEIEHQEAGGTPLRLEVRKALAMMLETELDNVYIKKFETKRGTALTIGEANVYESTQYAKLAEPAYIIERNIPSEEKPKEEAAPKPVEEKKKEEKKE